MHTIQKTCWGGKNVKCDFLSPGSPMPSIEQLEEELVRYQKRHPDATLKDIKARYGENYRQMIGYVHQVLGNLNELFPKYDKRQGYTLAGLVWFQGWNDKVDGAQRREKYAQYTVRLGQMIKEGRPSVRPCAGSGNPRAALTSHA